MKTYYHNRNLPEHEQKKIASEAINASEPLAALVVWKMGLHLIGMKTNDPTEFALAIMASIRAQPENALSMYEDLFYITMSLIGTLDNIEVQKGETIHYMETIIEELKRRKQSFGIPTEN